MKETTPSFRMELEIADKEYKQRREADKKSSEVLQEVFGNPVSVQNPQNHTISRYWQPHNYRAYFDFNKTTLDLGRGRFKSRNHDSEHEIKNYHNCTIRVKKTQIEIINLNYDGKWFLILLNNISELDRRIAEIADHLTHQCIEVLNKFIKEFGGSSLKDVLKILNENGITKEKFIDGIPEFIKWNDYPYSKKVYKHKTEIYGLEHTRTYIKNSVLTQFAPEIVDEMNEIHFSINPILWLKQRIRQVEDIVTHKKKIISLNLEQKKELTYFIFETLCN